MRWDTTAKYEFLLQVTNAIVAHASREGMFAALAGELKRRFAYDRLSIYILTPDTDALVYFASADGVVPKNMTDPAGRPAARQGVDRAGGRSHPPTRPPEGPSPLPPFLLRPGDAQFRAELHDGLPARGP